MQERRLSRPRGAEDRDELSGVNADVDVIKGAQRRDARVDLRHVDELDDGHAGAALWRASCQGPTQGSTPTSERRNDDALSGGEPGSGHLHEAGRVVEEAETDGHETVNAGRRHLLNRVPSAGKREKGIDGDDERIVHARRRDRDVDTRLVEVGSQLRIRKRHGDRNGRRPAGVARRSRGDGPDGRHCPRDH